VSDAAIAVRPDWGIAPRHAEGSAHVALPADAPIFLDVTGHRARLVRMLGRLAIGLGAAWAACVIAGATGTTPLPALGSALASRPSAPAVAGPARPGPSTLVARNADGPLEDPLDPATLVGDGERG
jgi:hypothetical protein